MRAFVSEQFKSHEQGDKMATKVKPIPEGYSTVTPYLYMKGAAKALDFRHLVPISL